MRARALTVNSPWRVLINPGEHALINPSTGLPLDQNQACVCVICYDTATERTINLLGACDKMRAWGVRCRACS